MATKDKLERGIMDVQDWCTTLENKVEALEQNMSLMSNYLLEITQRLLTLEGKRNNGQ